MSDALARNRVFVGGISWKADESSLANYFSSYGAVTECKIIMDRNTGKSKGYGFVTFQEADTAERVKQTANFFFLGKNMNVGDAVRKTNETGNGGGVGRGDRNQQGGYQYNQYYNQNYYQQPQGEFQYYQYQPNGMYYPQQPYPYPPYQPQVAYINGGAIPYQFMQDYQQGHPGYAQPGHDAQESSQSEGSNIQPQQQQQQPPASQPAIDQSA